MADTSLITARCSPWLQTPSQLLRNPKLQQECWTNSTPMTYCPPLGKRVCYSSADPALPNALRAWQQSVSLTFDAVIRPPPPVSCKQCATSEGNLGMRPCSKAQERQEAFVLDLAAAFGVERAGTFLEVGGNDGLKASNTVHAEHCRGWRGVLIEANYISFAKMLHNRPGVLAVRGALCEVASFVTFATRRSTYLRRRGGLAAPAVDLTGREMPTAMELRMNLDASGF